VADAVRDAPLNEVAPELQRLLNRQSEKESQPPFCLDEIRRQTVFITMADGTALATDLYFPPKTPAPAVVTRTPYGRGNAELVRLCQGFARYGYVALAQDCRGTGESEPEHWNYLVYEPEDGAALVEWIAGESWHDGFTGGFGGSYAGMTQWCMATNSRLSAIAPEVVGLRVSRSTVRPHMFVNGFDRAVGKRGGGKPIPLTNMERAIEAETRAGGYFDAPFEQRVPTEWIEAIPDLQGLSLTAARVKLWEHYCQCTAPERERLLQCLLKVEQFTYNDHWRLLEVFEGMALFGINSLPSTSVQQLCQKIQAPALMLTGWYDWNLGDTLQSWTALQAYSRPTVAESSRLIVSPSGHNQPGYREGEAQSPELKHTIRGNLELLRSWCGAVRDRKLSSWPKVIYYLTGANEWRATSAWPVPQARPLSLYLHGGRMLSTQHPAEHAEPDEYDFDPQHPTPTVGGSILSYHYPVGSVDVAAVQNRPDILTYTSTVLETDLDVVGPIRLILYARSSATDTDFAGRLSDVFPDGRAIQLQNGMLRARYGALDGEPRPLAPQLVYCLEIDLWATAHRFKKGHRIRLDISSADFPRFDRNTNRGGASGPPLIARQRIYHDAQHPSHLLVYVLTAEVIDL
jgi:uncharacterized protein